MITLADIHARPGFAPQPWQTRADGSAHKPPVGPSPDLARVCAIPRREQVEVDSPRAHALVRMMTARYALDRKGVPCRCRLPRAQGGITELGTDCIHTLNFTQAWALYEIGIVGGLLGPIGVGHGKTILDILATLAIMPLDETSPGRFEVVLLIPPNLVGQLITEYQLIGEHFRTPSLAVHGRDETFDQGPTAPILHVIPYSRLQRPESTVLLKKIKPRAIIADEAHYLRNRDAVRTHRVMSYFRENPETRFAGWTGTITDSSVTDYAHLSALALRYTSPLPLKVEVVKEWGSALDPKSDWPADAGALEEGLMRIGCLLPGEHIQKGFHRRLVETEGVVATRSSAIAAELRVTTRDAPPIPNTPRFDERAPVSKLTGRTEWPGIADALDNVREVKTRPDGEVLLDPLQVARCCRELACGFFYRWIYPRGEPEDLIEEWFAARKLWRAELREMLSPELRREHMDSPFLLTLAAMRAHGDLPMGQIEVYDEETGDTHLVQGGNAPTWRSLLWPRWRNVKELVKPDSEAVWIDEYLARDAAEWGHENRGIIWYDKNAFGIKVAEISQLPLHGGGPKAEEAIGRETGDRSIIASIKSHGTGRNGLQKIFFKQLVANPPSSATTWEQLLGRLHRIGQLAPIVFAEFYQHTDEMASSYHQARARAAYVQNTIGSAQKLNNIEDEDYL